MEYKESNVEHRRAKIIAEQARTKEFNHGHNIAL